MSEDYAGRVTLRDVLTLVGESEGRVTTAVKDGFEEIKMAVQTHDTRLKTLEDAQRVEARRNSDIIRLLSGGRMFFAVVIAAAALVVAIAK